MYDMINADRHTCDLIVTHDTACLWCSYIVVIVVHRE